MIDASLMIRIMTLALAIPCAELAVTNTVLAGNNQESQQMDTKPGPAYSTVEGQVIKIEGAVYTVQSPSPGYLDNGLQQDEVRVYVGKETLKLRGEKKVGDKIRAEITHGGFANSIQ